ncbi:MAG: hypothetical protein IPH20_21345 [Bacteroidales bacterium]|nr:hypothetical protein [Bacteroidales bacterium]
MLVLISNLRSDGTKQTTGCLQDEKDFKMIELTALPDEVRTAALKTIRFQPFNLLKLKFSIGEKVYR